MFWWSRRRTTWHATLRAGDRGKAASSSLAHEEGAADRGAAVHNGLVSRAWEAMQDAGARPMKKGAPENSQKPCSRAEGDGRGSPTHERGDIRGELGFRLHRQKVVKLRLMEARDVKKADTFGKSDPYCIVHWRGREIFRTETINKTLNPKWEDGESIELVMPAKPAAAQLVLSVWDKDKGSSDDFLGQVMFTGAI